MAENRDLLDLLTCSDYLPRQNTSETDYGDLRSQVQFLQVTAVLSNDSLDLQKSVIAAWVQMKIPFLLSHDQNLVL